METQRRWYDNDPTLSEAMELLSLSPDESKDMAADFILKLQEVIASDIIEKVYQTVIKYQGKGTRWYDSDPVMIKAIELLRVAPLNIQKAAAKKLLKALSSKELDELQQEFDDIETKNAELDAAEEAEANN